MTIHFLDASALFRQTGDSILETEIKRWLWFLSATVEEREDPNMQEIIREILKREPELEAEQPR